ncbi:Uncharacterized protein, PA2063/DUF2235 family [Methylobacterium sp. ap11]|uniref:DUF2235 domain-containing protein n=1 Tax=Methylobacterium sp. ap11 TaxID=1761799 RepID=UPI0008D3EEF3|nr:DUF2235 domain-containing protein [Methylobacterium sp. ap11]SEP41151.1 Uncharacterized protein, PA2063/DUF2235 family [Methylobacterium sp. ap11]
MLNDSETIKSPGRKRVALFLDGTWNTVGDNTNVWRLKALCAERGADGTRQVAYYSTGLGTFVGEKLRGGMFGYGLDKAVIDAYKWLVETYEPGDEIFIFGFSRGAYTARSLAGFISKCGLLKPGAPLGIGQLYDRYRKDETVSTIWKLYAAREAGLASGSVEERWMLDYAMRTPIKMIGVWDTVGALGVPFGDIPGISRSGFKFLHTGLRVSQENAYHAVAIDEHRKAFAPTLWTRKIRDNVPATSMAAPRPIASVEQRWFVGAHANVGGGCRSDLLAQIPLRWLMDKASSLGLSFRSTVTVDPDVLNAQLSNSYGEFLHGAYRRVSKPYHRIIGEPPRPFPGGRDETINETIDASVFDRWRANADYRPVNLADWAQRHGVEPGSITTPVLAHDPRTAVRS